MNTTSAKVDESVESEISSSRNRTLIVGLDGSASSDNALRYGARLAKALNVSVRGVIAWVHPIALSAYAISPLPDFEREARSTASEAADRVFGATWPDWFSVVVREGNAAQVLMKESAQAEMLVLGSRGHGGFVGLLLGSVSAECAEHAKCPVLIVHDGNAQAVEANP